MTLTSGTKLSFKYNSDGLRVSKTVGSDTVKYRWDGTTLLAEEHSGYTITFLYDGDTLVGFNYGGNNYYYGIDNLGVIHYVYNESGAVVVTYTYDAWGNTISASGNSTLINVNPIRYKSYYFDSETGLFYLQSRYYDAQVGRFVNADEVDYLGVISTVLSYNIYTYCSNNSVNNDDCYGTAPFLGWGIQFEGSFMGLSSGIEFIWYKNIANTMYGSRNLPCIYLYGSLAYNFKGGNVWQIKDVIKYVKNEVLRAFGSTKKAAWKIGGSVSVCAFVVYGTISTPNGYTGPFITFGGTLFHIKAYSSRSPKGDVRSLGVGVSSSKFGFSPISASYYFLIPKEVVISIADWFSALFSKAKSISALA